MRKFIKVCGILALIFFGAGLTLLISGVVLGGTNNLSGIVNNATNGRVQVNMDPDDFKIYVGNYSSDDIKDFFKGALKGKIYSVDDYTSKFQDGAEVLTGDVEKFCVAGTEVKKLQLNLSGSELTILNSEDGAFWLEAKNAGKLQASLQGDVLQVISTVRENGVSVSGKTPKVTLYVPSGQVLEEVKLELGAGRFEARELKSHKCELEIGAGDCNLSDVLFQEFDGEVGAGNLSLTGKLEGDVKVKCAAGNVDLTLTNLGIDFNYELECSLGNINLDGKKYSGLGTAKKIEHSADWDMKLDCSIGNISVQFK